jgi:hypothetical protein
MTAKHFAITIAIGIVVIAGGLMRWSPSVAAGSSAQMQMDMSADEGVPSYHAYALRPPLPAILDPKTFPDALNRNVYALAAKVRPALYQQPCYCYCDRHAGHKSLLDCFTSTHGSECDICQKEAVFAYRQTLKGKTPAQIRAAIIHGDWKAVDLQPYMNGPVAR